MSPVQERGGAVFQANPPRVLIVDDDAAFATTLGMALRRRGINTEIASDPITGMNLARELRPAVMLVDILMPGTDGMAFAQACRNEGIDAVLILMSGDLDAMRAANEAFAGVYTVIDKPVPIPALAEYLRGALSR